MQPQQEHSDERHPIEMPAPTSWPIVLAFGITLIGAGLVTHIAITVTGMIIAVCAAFGWWGQVIPVERHEYVPVHDLRPTPVVATGRSVARLKAGEDHHRARIPERIHPYSSGLWGGLAGGAVMALLACLYGFIVQKSIWYPVNLLAATVLPSIAGSTTEQLREFNTTAFLAALVFHGVFSILVGVLYAVTLPMFPRHASLWAGILAPLFWSGLIAATLDLLNPTLNERISWPWFVACQLGFGLVGGYVVARGSEIETMQSWPLADRAAFEARRDDPERK